MRCPPLPIAGGREMTGHAEGINTTFCGQCHLGITSAGHGSGEGSPWNAYVLEPLHVHLWWWWWYLRWWWRWCWWWYLWCCCWWWWW